MIVASQGTTTYFFNYVIAWCQATWEIKQFSPNG